MLPHVGVYRRVSAAHRRSPRARRFDLGDPCGVNAYGDDGPLIKVVLYRDGSANVFQVLLDHREPSSGPPDIALLFPVRRGHAKVKRPLFVGDAGTLVCKADGGASIKHGDDRLHEASMDKVLHNLADHHEGDVSTLLFHASIYGVGNLLQICPHVVLSDDYHARRGEHVVVYRDPSGIRPGGGGSNLGPRRRGYSI